MPRRTDLKSIAIIGSGPIVIGQAAEFDYSGTQGCRALKKEGYRIVLVNSNPATIMTDPEIADATYIEPINAQTVARILERERPDALLPTLGGQTALNVAMELAENGTLEKLGVELIGANREAIRKSEDRQAFKEAMRKIGMDVPRSCYAGSYDQAMAAAKEVGYPAIIRPSFTLGGTGGNIAYNHEEFDEFVRWGLAASPRHEILIEESVIGWKEFELEVMRDRADNVVIVCSIENLDPMGVHTGDSITVAPVQTLTDREYQKMRDAAIAIIREIGVDTGGCNIQFAVDPVTGRQTVIEMNPRVSRSSSLASKATGYPIAAIAARVAVGYTLDEITNEITGNTPVSFEPTIDYVVTKIPRFAFEKFPDASTELMTQMKSVGEVMSIGRTFEESLQKALRSLEIDRYGLEEKFKLSDWRVRRRAGMEDAPPKLEERLRHPTPGRPWYIAEAFRAGLTIERVHELTGIDPWFLQAFKRIVGFETQLAKIRSESPSKSDLVMGLKPVLREAKRMGFADRRLGQLLDLPEHEIRALREEEGVAPVFKTVDTCAAEFDSSTPYHYSTYDGIENEVRPSSRRKIMILGSGPNRIGQGIEFDYCCVHAAYSLRAAGFETIMVNCNPETVSTDWLTSDRLYFEPLTLEDVLAIVRQEKPEGVIVQFGGQTPLKLASGLAQAGVPILGTQPDAIDLAEDRERFRTLLDSLGLKQPASGTARSQEEALQVAAKLGYPVLVRPSYVLGGRAMKVVYEPAQLTAHLASALEVSNERPILVDRFLEDAIEVDVDAIGDGSEVVVAGVMEQIQEAGVHSGDSACALPPYSLEPAVVEEIRREAVALGNALKVVGLMNVQFAVKSGEGPQGVVVLEVNPRASRTVPFVSKATGVPLAKLAAQVMAGKSLADLGVTEAMFRTQHMSVKEAVFPFAKFPGVDPVLGPEMKSTGEVMGIDDDFGRAFAKSQHAANMVLPTGGTVFVSVRDRDKPQVLPVAKKLVELGFVIVATEGTRRFLNDRGVSAGPATKFSEGRPNIVDFIIDGKIALVINTPKGAKAASDSSRLRRATVQYGVPYYTTVAAAKAAVRAIETLRQGPLGVRPLQEYHAATKATGGGKNPSAAASRESRIGS